MLEKGSDNNSALLLGEIGGTSDNLNKSHMSIEQNDLLDNSNLNMSS